MSSSEEKTEAAIAALRKAANGNKTGIAELYDAYAPILNGLLLRMMGSAGDAEDVLQDVFIQVWLKAGQFDPARGAPLQWLATIARTRALDRLRSRQSRRRATERLSREPEAAGVDVERTAVSRETGSRVRSALGSIPDAQREVLALAYFEGLSQSEIAERLDRSLGTVKTQTRLGLEKLRDALRDLESAE